MEGAILLNRETVVIHIEKANPAFEGLYALINQAFLEKEWSEYVYANREQDLGEEGLFATLNWVHEVLQEASIKRSRRE